MESYFQEVIISNKFYKKLKISGFISSQTDALDFRTVVFKLVIATPGESFAFSQGVANTSKKAKYLNMEK